MVLRIAKTHFGEKVPITFPTEASKVWNEMSGLEEFGTYGTIKYIIGEGISEHFHPAWRGLHGGGRRAQNSVWPGAPPQRPLSPAGGNRSRNVLKNAGLPAGVVICVLAAK